MQKIYLLKACNEHKEHHSAKIIAAASDRHTLLVLIGGEILSGNMNYGGYTEEKAYMKFCEDLQDGIEVENNIDFGYVEVVNAISENDKDELKKRYENIKSFLENDEENEEFEM